MEIKLAELHVHLRGTVHPTLLSRLAGRNGVSVPVAAGGATYAWSGFQGFLEAYHNVAQAIRTPEDYAEVAADYLKRAARDGVIYCELMVSPDHAADMGISYGTLIAAVTEGIQSARESEAIEARVIVTCVRHRGPECAVQLAKLVTANPHPLVTGFGMAGDEEKYRPRDFATAFAIARDAGLGCTCHAGERCGPAAVWETIQELGVARLGHGVRSIEDRSLVEHISEVGFILEVCPTSNLKLGLYASPKEHPFLRLLRTGCKVTLNSDDPAHFDGSLLQEYRDAQHHFNLTDADVGGITRTAIEGAFCDAETKARLMGLLQSSP